VRIGLKVNQHQLVWATLLVRVGAAEDLGFDNVWIFDHFKPQIGDPTGPCMEAWSLLSAMAVATNRIRIGALATGVKWRHPSVLAAQAATIDNLSGGRLEIGMGAAWDESQHVALGVPFPAITERAIHLDEAIQVIRKLLIEDHATFDGEHYQLRDADYRPRPVQQPCPPIWVAAGGDRLMVPLAARRADVWHCFEDIDVLPQKVAVFEEHARRAGRDASSIRRAANLDIAGSDDDAIHQAARLRELGFSDIVVPWPSDGIGRVERFSTNALMRIREM
jgi:alkanesulfonate monooxygenase SsuD/methylene tetrahydromethanopterin reductase-like flavin-dependent oxidoreductase (luciferase family)